VSKAKPPKKKTAAQRVTELERKLAEADALLAKGKETLREHAGGMVELAEALAKKNKELEGAHRNAAGVAATIDFLWSEIDRYRNSLMDHIRWDAMLPEDLREAVRKVRMEAYAWEHDEEEKTS
jgi:chromosome segregation ATPase